MVRKVPTFKSDAEAAAFLDQDLSGLDFSQFMPASFEFGSKDAQLNMRVPKPLLDAVKQKAKARGMPYTRYIRELIEKDLTPRDKTVSSSRTRRTG